MSPLALLLVLNTQTPKPVVLRYEVDSFVISGGTATEPLRVPIQEDASEIRTSYRKDETSVYWDAIGLHIDQSNTVRTFKLEDIALTPKLFSKPQILETRELIAQGKRKREASTLSGSARVGNYVYFLPCWRDNSGKPWLEALVRVSLVNKNAKPELIGKFEGLSLAQGNIDKQLSPTANGLSVIVRTDSQWGQATYTIESSKFLFKSRGDGSLVAYENVPGVGHLIAERMPYGKTLTSLLRQNGSKDEFLESKGDVKFVGTNRPYASVIQTNLGLALQNLESGQTVNLPQKAVVRQTPRGFLVWREDKPEAATLYGLDRLQVIANSTLSTQ